MVKQPNFGLFFYAVPKTMATFLDKNIKIRYSTTIFACFTTKMIDDWNKHLDL